MTVLESIESPCDVRDLPPPQVPVLVEELRSRLIETVCATGGHLGPNLGVVELTVALHRVLDSPRSPIVFDTGHQSYVHKLLTGRNDAFDTLRQAGGLSGYPSRAESTHDLVENSHASTSLAYADGLSKAYELAGEPDRAVVAVIGDGALTGGLAWEGLNNLGTGGRRVVVVLNDNGRSYQPTVGALAHHLRRLRDRPGFARLDEVLGDVDADAEVPHGDEASSGYLGGIFEELGLRYVGPVDGHDVPALEAALRAAVAGDGPVVVHCLTEKGRGYDPAECHEADRMHAVGRSDVVTGRPVSVPASTWTDEFSDALLAESDGRDDLVAISAAMVGPTGLQSFATAHPDRCFDVGIAEQQAVTSAAGLAMGGQHPVVALYATFLNRGFDQLLLDVGLHGLPVTFVLDRAGVTGPDGASHHGMWDLALLGMVPGIRVAAPRDAGQLREQLGEALAHAGPTALRFPKATLGQEIPVLRRTAGLDLLRADPGASVLLVAMGPLAEPTVAAAQRLAADGIGCTVVDPRWVLPPSESLLDLADAHDLVVTVEDGLCDGGAGSRVAAGLACRGSRSRVIAHGLPTGFLGHARREDILAEHRLDAAGIAGVTRDALDGLDGHRPRRPVLAAVPGQVS